LRSSILGLMFHLSKRPGLNPPSLIIENMDLGDRPVNYGGFGVLWKGKIGEQYLGLKIPRFTVTCDNDRKLLMFMREGILWELFKHPNVLPFMGIHYMNKDLTQLCLVSPWMENGNLTEFLKNAADKKVDVHDVASGLAYLHERNIVHSDLKGGNILITPEGRACLADFGGSRVVDSQAIHFSSVTNNPSTGTLRWSAPELLNPYDEHDMYAFAGVCYEVNHSTPLRSTHMNYGQIFTGKVPLHEVPDAAISMVVVYRHRRPSRPDGTLPNDAMWKVMEDCWNKDFQMRPSASVVGDLVASLKTEFRPAREWDISDLSQIWKDVRHP
ncbi:kinase-like protein, partial [Marasmius fiardii PR-910]